MNLDCGLKSRGYAEVTEALANMVTATRQVRAELGPGVPAEPKAQGSPGDGAHPGVGEGRSKRAGRTP